MLCKPYIIIICRLYFSYILIIYNTSCRNTTSFKPCRKNARDDKILCKKELMQTPHRYNTRQTTQTYNRSYTTRDQKGELIRVQHICRINV